MDGEKKCEHDDFNQGDHCTICRPGFIMTDPLATCGCEEDLNTIEAWRKTKEG